MTDLKFLVRLARHLALATPGGQRQLATRAGINEKTLARILATGHVPRGKVDALAAATTDGLGVDVRPLSAGSPVFSCPELLPLAYAEPIDGLALRERFVELSRAGGVKLILERDGVVPLFEAADLGDDESPDDASSAARPSITLAADAVRCDRERALLRGRETVDEHNERIENYLSSVVSGERGVVLATAPWPAALRRVRALMGVAGLGALFNFDTPRATYHLDARAGPANLRALVAVLGPLQAMLAASSTMYMVRALEAQLLRPHFWRRPRSLTAVCQRHRMPAAMAVRDQVNIVGQCPLAVTLPDGMAAWAAALHVDRSS